jgi:hypothetical protein
MSESNSQKTYPYPVSAEDIFTKPFDLSDFTKEEQMKAAKYILDIKTAFTLHKKAVILIDPKDKLTPLIVVLAAEVFESRAGEPQIVAYNNQMRIVIE